jgi:hypothetical protein
MGNRRFAHSGLCRRGCDGDGPAATSSTTAARSALVAADAASAPACHYGVLGGAAGENADASEEAMLPNNPYWVEYVPANAPELDASPGPCAGEPGHRLFAIDRFASPLPIMTADW